MECIFLNARQKSRKRVASPSSGESPLKTEPMVPGFIRVCFHQLNHGMQTVLRVSSSCANIGFPDFCVDEGTYGII